MVFDVADHLRHVFQDLGHFLFPGVGIGDDVGDVALVGVGLVGGFAGVEVHIPGRPDGVVASEDGSHRRFPRDATDDGAVDLVAGVVGVGMEQEQLREGAVFAMDALGQPPLGDAEDLGEKVDVGERLFGLLIAGLLD